MKMKFKNYLTERWKSCPEGTHWDPIKKKCVKTKILTPKWKIDGKTYPGPDILSRPERNNVEEDMFEFLNRFNHVGVFDTDPQRYLGMKRFSEPPNNSAFLFIFDEESKQTFTTKGMKFPIDIYFYNKDGTMVGLCKDVKPDTNIVECSKPFKFVVEVAEEC